ncbi:dynein regulatory complex protein 8 [Nephila pilipes]|uniref:Dynein regulatory complex protein 8 n=1 Tax=Nephila pilipes TaxID=299642 RepID=A0A8X6NMX6_NEPPI|nr:dynein regulatory complex protein 8 [Nephila pilipes]
MGIVHENSASEGQVIIKHPTEDASPYEINIQKQIIEAFRVFDENDAGRINIENLGIVVRALGRVPRKAEIKQFKAEVEDPDAKGFVKLEVLLPALTNILLQDKWKPASKEQLREAFEFFDVRRTGRLSPTFLSKLLTDHGDKLKEEEIESFLSTMVNPFRKKIEYDKFYEQLVVPESLDILENKRKIMSEIKDEA